MTELSDQRGRRDGWLHAAAGSAAFGYDANGNLTSDGSTTFGYDAENRLVSASGGKSASLIYDPDGRLFQTSGSSTGVTQFLYDGDALVAEYDGSGSLLRRYVHGPDPDEPLIWLEGSGTGDRRWLHGDHQGSIVAVSDGAGQPIAINAYDDYGIPGTTSLGRFRYTGQAWLAELGMYYYKARIYSPTLGRFMQTDPIGYKDQINLYAYVANDPINQSDPTGEEESKCNSPYGHVNCDEHLASGQPDAPPKGSVPKVSSDRGSGTEAKRTPQNDDIVVTARRKVVKALDNFAENYLKPPPGRQEGESISGCMARLTSTESAGVSAAAVELGRANKALYPRGAPAGASGTSYISTTVRAVERALGGGGVGSRGNYWFGAKTIGGAIGRGLSMLSAGV